MSVDPSDNPRRRPKGDKRARTRKRILEAARELIREKGHEQTTLQAVAARAGMTSGAIYGNFRNRDDLFIALSEAYWAPIRPTFREDASFAEKMQDLARATVAAIPERQEAAYGRLTGMAHALRSPSLAAQVEAVTAASYDQGAAWIRQVADPAELPMSPELLARAIHALTEGLLLQRFLTPDLIPDELFLAAFAALAGAPAKRVGDL
jgi:AcrR family transcriptional regulator